MNKNSKNTRNEIPEEVLALVPWHVMNSLSNEDKIFFEKAQGIYPSLKAAIETEKLIVSSISTDKSLLNKSAIASQDERLKAVLNIIDIEDSKQLTNNKTSVIEKIKSLFESLLSNKTGSPQYARVGSTAVLSVCVAALTAFVAPLFTDENKFIPASAEVSKTNTQAKNSDTSQTILLVGFNGSAEDLDKNTVLAERNIAIKNVPNRDGVYQVTFEDKLDETKIKNIINSLLSQKESVWFAGESFESQ